MCGERITIFDLSPFLAWRFEPRCLGDDDFHPRPRSLPKVLFPARQHSRVNLTMARDPK